MTHAYKKSYFTSLIGGAILLALAWLIATQPLTWLLAALAVVGGATLLLRWPWLIWPLLGAALPWAANLKFGFVSALDLLLAVAIGLWLAIGGARKTLRLDFIPVTLLAVVYASIQLFSSLYAVDLGEAATETLKWLEFIVVLLLARQMTPPGGRRWLAAAILAGAVSQALLGLYQFTFHIGPDWFTIGGRFMRASGSFRQPNPFAGFLGLSLPIALSLALWSWTELGRKTVGASNGGQRNRPLEISSASQISRKPGIRLHTPIAWSTYHTVSFVVIAAGVLASWSRGGWLAAIAGVGVVFILFSRRVAIVAGVGLLLIVSGAMLGSLSPALIPTALRARMGDLSGYFGVGNVLNQEVNDDNFAVVERVAHWAAAIRMWEAAPWLGVGAGNYAAVYPKVRLPQWEDPLGHAHNIYLNVLAEGGLLGFAAFGALWVGTATWLVQRRRAALRTGDRWGASLAVGALGMLTYLAVHSLFDNLFVQGIYVLIALWLAVVDLNGDATQGTMQSTRPSSEDTTVLDLL